MEISSWKLQIENSFPQKIWDFEKIQILKKNNIEYWIFEDWKNFVVLLDWHPRWIVFWLQQYLSDENTRQLAYVEKKLLPKIVFLPSSRFVGLLFENTNFKQETGKNKKYEFSFADLEKYFVS